MSAMKRPRIGFTCAYTPLPLIHAAGFEPYRILPVGDAPDQAGTLLHDNLCPHVKRLLDRALAPDLPELAGVVLVNSCDAMRRLADAWPRARPSERVVLMDLPVADDESSVAFLASELQRLREVLGGGAGGWPVEGRALVDSVTLFNELAQGLSALAGKMRARKNGAVALQREAVLSVTTSLEESLERLKSYQDLPKPEMDSGGVPVYLFGNVLPDPEALELFNACGCRVVYDDLCTGSRQLAPLAVDSPTRACEQMARAILQRPPCARTFKPERPGWHSAQVATQAEQAGVRGVIAHVMKFCDPYLSRMPALRAELRTAGLPLLVLEGDCSLRSLGQQRTRIEAFVEMIEG